MIEVLYGVEVEDDDGYTQYRAAMSPVLARHGGSFTFDAKVAQLLRPDEGATLNRVFTLRFPSEARMRAFFQHPEYLEIRGRLFDSSVSQVRQLGKYTVLD